MTQAERFAAVRNAVATLERECPAALAPVATNIPGVDLVGTTHGNPATIVFADESSAWENADGTWDGLAGAPASEGFHHETVEQDRRLGITRYEFA